MLKANIVHARFMYCMINWALRLKKGEVFIALHFNKDKIHNGLLMQLMLHRESFGYPKTTLSAKQEIFTCYYLLVLDKNQLITAGSYLVFNNLSSKVKRFY